MVEVPDRATLPARSRSSWGPATRGLVPAGGGDAREWTTTGGAVKEYITDAGTTDPAWPLCRLAEGASKTRCSEAVGEYLIILSSSDDGRLGACQRAEPEYVAVCRDAARV